MLLEVRLSDDVAGDPVLWERGIFNHDDVTPTDINSKEKLRSGW